MKLLKALTIFWLSFVPLIARAEPSNVVADIAPVHSLVAKIMQGVDEPALVLDATRSPHAMALRPSDARVLQSADIVFSVGVALEGQFDETVKRLAPKAIRKSLNLSPGLQLLPGRTAGVFGAVDGNATPDAHVWLSVQNAKIMLKEIADTLATFDPENAKKYRENLQSESERLASLQDEIKQTVASSPAANYLLYHDATQYFEAEFNRTAAGTLFANDELPPSISTLKSLANYAGENAVACMLVEPGYNAKLTANVFGASPFKAVEIDVLGTRFAPGPELYNQMMFDLAESVATCLNR